MNKLIILILLSLVISGCEKKIKEVPKPPLSEDVLRDIAINAVNGDRIYIDSLSGLFDYSLLPNSTFNTLRIQKIITPSNKTFFALLIEFPNPAFNRFAVYDSALHLVLMDKSLNGKIGLKTLSIHDQQFIEIDESFLSKDIMELNRVSLYRMDSTVKLIFRTFTKFSVPKTQYYQIITEISHDRIRTNLTSTKRSLISGKSDIFNWDNNQNKYISAAQIFGNFVKAQVASFKGVLQKPEITDEYSVRQSPGISEDSNTAKMVSNIHSKSGYYLSVDENWKEIKDIGLYGFADRLKGDKYYNPMMGTNIFITLIPEGDSAEVYVKTRLENIIRGKYRVRYSDKIEQKKFYIQYFEFNCGTRKYLLIFEASKYTYEKYKATYQEIINSFVMEC